MMLRCGLSIRAKLCINFIWTVLWGVVLLQGTRITIYPVLDLRGSEQETTPVHDVHERMCVVVLTAFPTRTSREPLVNRLVNQLHDLPLPLDVELDVHLYCDGDCSAFRSERNFSTFSLRPLVKDLPKSTLKVRRITQLYRLMLDHLFVVHNQSWCVILEDDLVLAPDAMLVLYHGQKLLEKDQSIFTVSLFNDNSFPHTALDQSAFRRVSHFSGLGFIMAQQWYIDLIRPSWQPAKAWDTYLQMMVSKNFLVSIVPEVTRVMHITNPQYSGNSPITMPRNSFESHILANTILPEYNLSSLTLADYNTQLAKMIYSAEIIENIEDACYTDNAHLVYLNCPNSLDMLSKIMVERHLWGKGNGGIVRGVYHGLLLLRMCSSLVIIICKDSHFYPQHPSNTFFATTAGLQNPLGGLIHRLQTKYTIVTGSDGLDCNQVCSTISKQCDIKGLFLLNNGCKVLQTIVPSCQTCSEVKVKNSLPYTGDMPAMLSDGNCCTGWLHFSSCFARNVETRRVCPCS